MTRLQQHLYEYIEDERLPALQLDGEYLLAQRLLDDAEKKLLAGLSDTQKHDFISFMDMENLVDSICLRYVFQETLAIIHNILPL